MASKRREKSWIPGKERVEKVLADATTIDGRKEWICKFCSESNVWAWWRCRKKSFPKELHEGGVKKLLRAGVVSARTWGVHAVEIAPTERLKIEEAGGSSRSR